jgi:hypothetical protein
MWRGATQAVHAAGGRLEGVAAPSPGGDRVRPLGAAPSAVLGTPFESGPPADKLTLVAP